MCQKSRGLSHWKDLKLLTFLKSFVFFFCPPTGDFTLSLGRRQILFVSAHLQGRLAVVIETASRWVLFHRCWDETRWPNLSYFGQSSHDWSLAAFNWTFLWAQLLWKCWFIPRIVIWSSKIVFRRIELFACALMDILSWEALRDLSTFLVFWLRSWDDVHRVVLEECAFVCRCFIYLGHQSDARIWPIIFSDRGQRIWRHWLICKFFLLLNHPKRNVSSDEFIGSFTSMKISESARLFVLTLIAADISGTWSLFCYSSALGLSLGSLIGGSY